MRSCSIPYGCDDKNARCLGKGEGEEAEMLNFALAVHTIIAFPNFDKIEVAFIR